MSRTGCITLMDQDGLANKEIRHCNWASRIHQDYCLLYYLVVARAVLAHRVEANQTKTLIALLLTHPDGALAPTVNDSFSSSSVSVLTLAFLVLLSRNSSLVLHFAHTGLTSHARFLSTPFLPLYTACSPKHARALPPFGRVPWKL